MKYISSTMKCAALFGLGALWMAIAQDIKEDPKKIIPPAALTEMREANMAMMVAQAEYDEAAKRLALYRAQQRALAANSKVVEACGDDGVSVSPQGEPSGCNPPKKKEEKK